MGLFDRQRILGTGFSLFELVIIGVLATLFWIIGMGISSLISEEPFWLRLRRWEDLRFGLGILVGAPLYGYLAGKLVKTPIVGQMIGVTFGVSGGGALILLAFEMFLKAVLG